MIRRLCLATAGCLVVLSAPAHADRWSAPEPQGDAVSFSFDPEPEPCGTVVETPSQDGDITRLGVNHRRNDVVLRTKVVGLEATRLAYLDFPVRTNRRTWQVDVVVRKGRVRASLLRTGRPADLPEPGECGYYIEMLSGAPCRDLEESFDARLDQVVVRIPRTCLRSPRWVQAGLEAYAFIDESTQVFDEWSPPGADDGNFLTPVYGERVRRASRTTR